MNGPHIPVSGYSHQTHYTTYFISPKEILFFLSTYAINPHCFPFVLIVTLSITAHCVTLLVQIPLWDCKQFLSHLAVVCYQAVQEPRPIRIFFVQQHLLCVCMECACAFMHTYVVVQEGACYPLTR